MGDERREASGRAGGGAVAGVLNPEKGSTRAITRLQMAVKEVLEKHLLDVVGSISGKVAENHLPSLKLLMDFARMLKELDEVPQSEYESFAAVLYASLQTMDEDDREQGTGNRE